MTLSTCVDRLLCYSSCMCLSVTNSWWGVSLVQGGGGVISVFAIAVRKAVGEVACVCNWLHQSPNSSQNLGDGWGVYRHRHMYMYMYMYVCMYVYTSTRC